MRNGTSLKKCAMTLFLIASVSGCASQQTASPPSLDSRTLRISRKVPGFEYQWFECKKPGLFRECREYEKKVEYFDLRDEVTREKLINMGFVARVREKVLP
jgi:hypothetical protein